MKAVKLNIAVCLILLSSVYALYYMYPVGYLYLITEDCWGEYATAACYIFSFIFLILVIWFNHDLRKPGYFLMAFLFLFIGMEEISWGQRLFGLDAPYAITRLNYQSEFNLHNIVDTHIRLSTLFNYAVLIWIFIFPIFLKKVPQIKWLVLKTGIPFASSRHIPFFILSLFFLIAHPIVKSDEVGELFLGIAFFLFTIDTFAIFLVKNNFGLKDFSEVKVKLLLFFIMLILSHFLVIIRPSKDSIRWHLNNLAAVEFPKNGLYAQAEKLFLFAIKNPSLMFPDTFLSYGLLLKEMKSDRADGVLHQALEEQYKSISKDPLRPELYRNAGRILNLLNKPKEANNEFQKALQLDQKRLRSAKMDWEKVSALRSLGRTYIEMKEYALAIDVLQQGLIFASEREAKLNIADLIRMLKKKMSDNSLD